MPSVASRGLPDHSRERLCVVGRLCGVDRGGAKPALAQIWGESAANCRTGWRHVCEHISLEGSLECFSHGGTWEAAHNNLLTPQIIVASVAFVLSNSLHASQAQKPSKRLQGANLRLRHMPGSHLPRLMHRFPSSPARRGSSAVDPIIAASEIAAAAYQQSHIKAQFASNMHAASLDYNQRCQLRHAAAKIPLAAATSAQHSRSLKCVRSAAMKPHRRCIARRPTQARHVMLRTRNGCLEVH